MRAVASMSPPRSHVRVQRFGTLPRGLAVGFALTLLASGCGARWTDDQQQAVIAQLLQRVNELEQKVTVAATKTDLEQEAKTEQEKRAPRKVA